MSQLLDLPGNIQAHFRIGAVDMFYSLNYNQLKVGLVDAPDPRHEGHKVRIALGNNTQWYKDFFANRGKNTDRQRVLDALWRMIKNKKPIGTYDHEIFDAVKEYLQNDIQEPDVVKYFETGIPF